MNAKRIHSIASAFGGGFHSNGEIIVPAERLLQFLDAVSAASEQIYYIDCLYIGSNFLEPSMELSCLVEDFSTSSEFLGFAADAAAKAIVGAGERGPDVTAVFSVAP